MSWLAGIIAAVLANAPATPAGAGVPALVIDWSVNGGAVNHVVPLGRQDGDVFRYEGDSVDPATGLHLTFDLSADPFASLAGNVAMYNALAQAISANVEVSLPFAPNFASGSLLSGQADIGLTTGPGGGMISSQPPALFQTMIDHHSAGFATTLFWDPFFMSTTGQGNLATHTDYGIPNPVPGPPILESVGYRLNFQLTPLDLASIIARLTATGEATTCDGDLDGDGEVGFAELMELLIAWGDCADPQDCPADLDGDGNVGITDLLALMAVWGPCP